MVRSDFLLLLRDHPALFLRADSHLHEGLGDILLSHIPLVLLCRIDGRLVQKILQIRPGEACRGLGHLLQVHILRQRLVLGMDLQNVFSAPYVRRAHRVLSVEASRPENGGIQNVHPVRGRHDNDAFVDAKSIHFHQKLV